MKACSRQIDLSPSMPVWMSGYMTENRLSPAEGIHDAPQANAVLLETEGGRLLWVVMDVISVPEEATAPLREALSHEFDLSKENILISGIHSHSCPGGFMDESAFGHPEGLDYRQEAIEKVIEGLKGMADELQEVKAEIATGKVSGYYSKRTDITAPYDDSFTLIRFINPQDKTVAAWLNFNCHATVVGPQNMLLTADLIGAIRERAQKQLGIAPLTFTGASGDISNRQYRQGNDFAELDRVADGLWAQMSSQLDFTPIHLNLENIESYEYRIACNPQDQKEDYERYLAAALKVLEDPNSTFDERKMAITEKLLSEDRLKMEWIDFAVKGKVLHLEDLTIVTFPGELACTFGLQLKAKKKTPYFLMAGYTEDYQGYFIEQEEYGRTYETKASMTPKGETEKIIQRIGEYL